MSFTRRSFLGLTAAAAATAAVGTSASASGPAAAALPGAAAAVSPPGDVVVYSRTSGHDLMTVLVVDGAWSAWRAQCHHASMGAPSPRHANQPW